MISIIQNKISLFENNEIRKIFKNNEWYYSVLDIISFFTDCANSTDYLKKLKNKDILLKKEWDNLCINVNMKTKDGKIRKTISTNTIGALRIIESINEEKAEPIKRWLARLGNERIEEISNPEMLMNRMKQIYKVKGYSDDWIEKREREITTRHSLKEKWQSVGIDDNQEYLYLMNEIYKTTFGIDCEEYRQLKGITEMNYLKDSMTNLELSLMNMNESLLVELHRKNNSRNLEEILKDINNSGKIINNTKKEIETILEKEITSNENIINLTNDKI